MILGSLYGLDEELFFSLAKDGAPPGSPGNPSISQLDLGFSPSFTASDDGDVDGLVVSEDDDFGEAPSFLSASSDFSIVVRKNGVEIFRFSGTGSFRVAVVAGDVITYSIEGNKGSKKVTTATYLRRRQRPNSSSSSAGAPAGGSSSSSLGSISLDDGVTKWDSEEIEDLPVDGTDDPVDQMVYGKGVYVGVSLDFNAKVMNIFNSTDGKSWKNVLRATNVSNTLEAGLAFGQGGPHGSGIFVVVARNLTLARYWWSTNGVSWKEESRPLISFVSGVLPGQIWTDNITYEPSINRFRSFVRHSDSEGIGNFMQTRLQGGANGSLVHELKSMNKRVRPQVKINNYWYGIEQEGINDFLGNKMYKSGRIESNTDWDQMQWQFVGNVPGTRTPTYSGSMATNGTVIVLAGVGLYSTSNEGQTWTANLGGANRNWQSVIYSGGSFVASGEDAQPTVLAPALYEPDELGVPVLVRHEITYKKKFVAYSTDGVNWTSREVTVVDGLDAYSPVGERLFDVNGKIGSSNIVTRKGKRTGVATIGSPLAGP